MAVPATRKHRAHLDLVTNQILWGLTDTQAPDANLYRSDVGTLKTDGKLIALGELQGQALQAVGLHGTPRAVVSSPTATTGKLVVHTEPATEAVALQRASDAFPRLVIHDGGILVGGGSSAPTTLWVPAHTHPWGEVTATPTTLAGYGITGPVLVNSRVGLGFSSTISAGTTAQNWKIASLPATGTATGASVQVSMVHGIYKGDRVTLSRFLFGTRDGFSWEFSGLGYRTADSGVRVYLEGDGTYSIYASLPGTAYASFNVEVREGGWYSVQAGRATVYATPANVGASPPGTLVFDSTSSSYPATLQVSNTASMLTAARVERVFPVTHADAYAILVKPTWSGGDTGHKASVFATASLQVPAGQTLAAYSDYRSDSALTDAGTVTTLNHFYAGGSMSAGAIGTRYGLCVGNWAASGGSVGAQYGVLVNDLASTSLSVAFSGKVSLGSNKWNLYCDGSALNHLTGSLLLGTTSNSADSAAKLFINGNAYVGGVAKVSPATVQSAMLQVGPSFFVTSLSWIAQALRINGSLYLHDESGTPDPNALYRFQVVKNDALKVTSVAAGTAAIETAVFRSTIPIGTAPLVVASNTVVANLNADLFEGQHGTYYTTVTNLTLPTSFATDANTIGIPQTHLFNTVGDEWAFKTIQALEYWDFDTSAWLATSGFDPGQLLTGRVGMAQVTVPPANRRWRFVVATNTYLGQVMVAVHQAWNQGAHQLAVTLERGPAATGPWTTMIPQTWSPAGESNYHFFVTSSVAQNSDTYYRITVESVDAVNATWYTGLQLLYTYTRNGLHGGPSLPFTWNSKREIAFPAINTFLNRPVIEMASPALVLRQTGDANNHRWVDVLSNTFRVLKTNDAYASFTSQLVIDSTGNLGINQGTPTHALHVTGPTANLALLEATRADGPVYLWMTNLTTPSSTWGLAMSASGEFSINKSGGGHAVIFASNYAATFTVTPLVGAHSIWHAGNDGSGSGLDADLWDGSQRNAVSASLRANLNLTGGGTLSLSAAAELTWSQRLIVIANGRGAWFSTVGFFDINVPAAGTVISALGGGANQTVTANGIPLTNGTNLWVALYYILPIGSGSPSVPANFRLVSYSADLEVPEHWILLALRNPENGTIRLGTGVILRPGTSYAGGTFSAAWVPDADKLDGYHASSFSLAGHDHAGVYEGAFAKGSLVQGLGVTLSGTLTGRLVGSGDITITGTGVTDHGALTGSGDDDHPQYLNNARGDARYASLSHNHAGVYEPALSKGDILEGAGILLSGNLTGRLVGTGNVTIAARTVDHGALTGLGDDDHAQYHNDQRGDLRYALTARGLPSGGATPQVLKKSSSTDYAVAWGNVGFNELSGIPTTLAGHSIGDAYTKTEADLKYLILASGGMVGGAMTVASTLALSNLGADLASGTGYKVLMRADSGSGVRGITLSGLKSHLNYQWDDVGGKPTTFTPSAHSHAWTTDVTGKPTTLAGYGITDAVGGSGTTDRIPILTAARTLGNSALYKTGGFLAVATGTAFAVDDDAFYIGGVKMPRPPTNGSLYGLRANSPATWEVLSTVTGVPAGGTTGQALVKSSNSDFAVTWGTVSTGLPALPSVDGPYVLVRSGGSFFWYKLVGEGTVIA